MRHPRPDEPPRGVSPAASGLFRGMPIAPLAATLAVQTLATAALFSIPAIAPAIAAALHVNGELVGTFVAVAYGTGIVSALLSPGLIRRYGGVRATQVVLVTAAGMVAIAATGHLVSLALAAVVLGLGYGAAAPASTHLLVPQTPRPVFNLVMSVRQIGVPLGGVLGALILPPLVLAIGWRLALLTELAPILLLLALIEYPRRRWDAGREPGHRALGRTLLQPFALLRDRRIRRLSVASFVYSGTQLTFVAFMTVDLTSTAGFNLVQAGRVLALYQIARTRQPAGLGLGGRQVPDAQPHPGRARVRHCRGIGGGRTDRRRVARLGRGRGRLARGLHRRRLYRGGLCRLRPSRRRTAHRGDRPRHRHHVRRRDADPADLRHRRRDAGGLRGALRGARVAGGVQCCAVGPEGVIRRTRAIGATARS